MHNNAPIHTAKKVTDWLTDHGVVVIEWLLYSPELNRKRLKDLCKKSYPDIMASGDASEEARTAMGHALVDCWQKVPDSLFKLLIESMPDRITACIEAEGWHTKY